MDHAQALKLQAVEKYLLGALSPAESEEFELHFFACQECAGDLKLAVMMAENLKAVAAGHSIPPSSVEAGSKAEKAAAGRRWIWTGNWLRFPIPALAAVLLCTVAVYQNMVTMPRLRQQAEAASYLDAPVAYSLRAAARGSEAEIVVVRHTRSILLRFDSTWDRPVGSLDCDLTGPRGAAPLHVRQRAPDPGRGLYLLVPTRSAPAGRWTLVVRDADAGGGSVLAQYSFQIRYE